MTIDLQFKYWSGLISKQSIPFNNLFVNNSNAYIHPITINEVKSCYNTFPDGSPGIDRLKKCYLTKIGLTNITARFNMYLISSTAPFAFKLGLTTLIPKTKYSTEPSHYRPITMSLIFCRIYHYILARRIEKKIRLNPRQKAFVRRDGIAENIFLLKNIIYQHTNALRPLNMYLLNVSKAFDILSHNSIVALAEIAWIETVENSKSTLKPKQKLFMLTNHLIPSMFHMLTFSNVYLNSLKTMDISIRSFVRRWLRLPSDTSLGVFYAPSSVGGIAITRFFWQYRCCG